MAAFSGCRFAENNVARGVSARLRDDGMVIYSERGAHPIENQEMPLHLIESQLDQSGFSYDKVVEFMIVLRRDGFAEIQEQRPPSSFSLS